MGGPPLKTDYFNGIRNSRFLKLRFIFLSKKMHPDRCFDLGSEEKHAQGILFAKMVEDYKHLKELDLTKVDYIMLRRPVLDSDDEWEPEEKQSTTRTTTDREEQAQIFREEQEWIKFMRDNSLTDSEIYDEIQELNAQNDRELKKS